MSDNQRDTDPLPYTQVDRAVRAKAAQLADLLDVTRQHALGGLAEFWDLCGDPRELERLLKEGKDEVVLTPDDVRRRFRIALNKEADPADLAVLGLLEPRGESYRVRGMSRYFQPLERRLKRKASGSLGGRASVASRLSTPQAPAQAPAQANGNTADSGQRTAVISSKKLAGAAKKPADPRHAPLVKALCDATPAYAFTPRDAKAVTTLLALGPPDEVVTRWRRALAHEGYPRVRAIHELPAKWQHFGARDGAPSSSLIGEGPIVATMGDF